jgi:hypothetical protein
MRKYKMRKYKMGKNKHAPYHTGLAHTIFLAHALGCPSCLGNCYGLESSKLYFLKIGSCMGSCKDHLKKAWIAFSIIISSILYIADVISDMALAIRYFKRGIWTYGRMHVCTNGFPHKDFIGHRPLWEPMPQQQITLRKDVLGLLNMACLVIMNFSDQV